MTLKEFLKMNTNGLLLQIFIYDKENEYVMGDEKRYFIDKNIFLDKTVLSFEIYENDLYIKLASYKVFATNKIFLFEARKRFQT